MNTSMPKISVIIPAYNVSAYIEECLDSVLTQDFRDIEVICVDDCSQDSTPDIIESYCTQDNRVRLIRHTANRGQSEARNTGTAAASGEYIYYMDSDDCLQAGSLDRMYSLSAKNDLDLLLFDMERFCQPDCEGIQNWAGNSRTQYLNTVYTGRELLLLQSLASEYRSSVPLQFIHADFLKKTGITFFPRMLHEDDLFSPILMDRAERVMCIPDKFYRRRVRTGSIMTTKLSHKNVDGHYLAYVRLLTDYMTGGSQSEGLLIRAQRTRGLAWKQYLSLPQGEQELAGTTLPTAEKYTFEQSNFGLEKVKNQFRRQLKEKDLSIEDLLTKISGLNAQIADKDRIISQNQKALADQAADKDRIISEYRKALADQAADKDRIISEYQKALADQVAATDQLRSDYARSVMEYEDALNAFSVRLGRWITFLPRKIRDFLRSFGKTKN